MNKSGNITFDNGMITDEGKNCQKQTNYITNIEEAYRKFTDV